MVGLEEGCVLWLGTKKGDDPPPISYGDICFSLCKDLTSLLIRTERRASIIIFATRKCPTPKATRWWIDLIKIKALETIIPAEYSSFRRKICLSVTSQACSASRAGAEEGTFA